MKKTILAIIVLAIAIGGFVWALKLSGHGCDCSAPVTASSSQAQQN